MSRISNPSAPIDAPKAPAAGDVTSAFDASRLPRSRHPALNPASVAAGGRVAELAALAERMAGKAPGNR